MKKGWSLLFLSLLLPIITEAFVIEKPVSRPFSPVNSPPQAPPNSCNLAEIRDKLTKAGNVELLNMDNSCSLYFINPKVMSGPNAQKYAESFGANLISVQSAQENTDLGAALAAQGYGNEVIWIGLGDQKTEGTFEWYDGSDVVFTNWKPGEPNNSGGGEHCTQIFTDGFWNDLSCDGYNSMSVMEVSLCPVTKTLAPPPICQGDSTTLTTKTILGAPNYKYAWVSDPPGFTSTEESPKVAPAINTTYSVTVTDRYGCISLNSVKVAVSSLNANITTSGSTIICSGDSVVLTASTGISYEWSTRETSQSITVKASGNYIVKITSGVCTRAAQKTVTVFQSPNAGFENTTVCLGTATSFTDKSTDALGWVWNFGDGTPVIAGQNPTHKFARAGVFTVTLGVAGAGNCVDSIQQKVTVHDTPVASFSTVNSCTKDTIYFKNTSTSDPSTTIKSYVYDFGDGKTGNMPDMGHFYTKGGTYKVTLKITTADGCIGSVTNSTIIDDSPVAAATGILNICASDTAKFINKSTLTAGNMRYYWNFGDGSSIDSTVANPSHVYAAGTYTVTLAIVSDKGCADTLRQPIEIYPAVKADFSAADVCLHEPVLFKNLSTGPVETYDWNFNDNTTGSDKDPSHVYILPKTYNVSLTVLSAKNCKSVITKKVAVHELPIAKYTASNVCDGKNVIFKDQSTITGTSVIRSWIWDFGDGSPFDSITSPQHLYPGVKKYTAVLRVITNFGCIDSIVKQITVNPNPLVNFTTSDTAGCHPFKTSFSNQSSIVSGKIQKWLWEFGSINAKSDLKDPPPYLFKNTSNTNPVKYTIKLTATSDSGCVTNVSKPNYITVLPKPLADFSLSPREALVTNPMISFKNLSIGADSSEWAFDNFGSSNVFNPPPFSFVDTGTFVVTLIASNLFGCSDTTFKEVIIEPDYVIYIPNAFTPNGDEVNDTFGPKGSFIMDFEMTIYDRWGNMMYQTKDMNLPWNGGIKGSTSVLAEEAVYVYIIKIKGDNKRNYSYKGAVSVVR